ncbi:hypothetical protein G5714_011167 [Onychostoma macrolepis]|uniref:Uncharacterized protein n=1 Tax=Onychostoma macrolepis TaxID=369639 RepID=A0A7J6CM52_9TELE|nr:hypothetical protein G5714_011167 [Onychostoma macrolepis]
MNRDTTLPLPRQTACLPDHTLPVLAGFELTATELEEKLTKEDSFRHLLIRPYKDSHLPLISSANRHSPGGPVGITPQQPMAVRQFPSPCSPAHVQNRKQHLPSSFRPEANFRCALHEQSRKMACTVGGQIIPQLNVEEATEDSSPSRSISTRRSKTFSPFSSRKHQRLPGTQGQHALVKA